MAQSSALVGATGFVGSNLRRQRGFDSTYSSIDIDRISGRAFDLVVCAGAPATMWQANEHPSRDRANLETLVNRLKSAKIGRLVLISTIAVYADAGRGDTETDAEFETTKAYGKNRRWLEIALAGAVPTTVVRLPALYGPGLKKNFLFDLLNPAPSFLKPDRHAALRDTLTAEQRAVFDDVYDWDEGLGMQALNRTRLANTPAGVALTAALAASPFAARTFTNADSTFQYYGLHRLADDIDTAVGAGLSEVNLTAEPWRAGDLHEALMGEPFANAGPPQTHEAMRTVHADVFGRHGPWLISADEVAADIRAFFAGARGR